MRIPKLPRNVWILTGASFLTDVSSEMIAHVIPLFLANVLGARTVTIGLIEGIAETTASLFKLLSGWLSDRMGQRKWLTASGYAISTVAKPFLVLAGSPLAVLAVRFADRVGKGIRTAPRDALLADSVETGRRGLAFGFHRAGDTFGAVLGLLGASLVVGLLQGSTPALEEGTFRMLVWVSVVPAVLAVVLLATGIREPRRQTAIAKPRLAWTSLPGPFRRYVLIATLFTLGNSSDAFLVLRAQERGLSVLEVMGLLVLFNVVYATVSSPAGALSDRWGRRKMLLLGWTTYAVLYAGFAFMREAWHVWALFAAYGLYYGFAEGSAKAYVADLVGAEQRGTAYGVFHAAIGLAALPASLIAGLLWQGIGSWSGFGAGAPFLFGAVMAALAGMLLVTSTPGVKARPASAQS